MRGAGPSSSASRRPLPGDDARWTSASEPSTRRAPPSAAGGWVVLSATTVAPAGARRLDARGSVLQHQTLARRDADELGGAEVALGTGLALPHVLCRDQHRGSGRPAPASRARAKRRAPEVTTAQRPLGKRREELPSAGERRERRLVRHGALTELVDLGAGVELGRGEADCLHRATAVTIPEERLGVEPLGHGPFAPLSLDVGGGVDQDPIQVEQNGGAFKSHR